MSALVAELKSLARNRSDLSQTEAAAILRVSRARISQLAKENNLRFRDGRQAHGRPLQPWGGANEDAVAINDLLERGLRVYRAATSASRVALVVDHGGALLRVMVLGPSRQQAASHPATAADERDLCDVLAIVSADGSIAYQPRPGVDWETGTRDRPAPPSSHANERTPE